MADAASSAAPAAVPAPTPADEPKGEMELLKLRAKLFRFAKEANPPEWKERGTGNVKILSDPAQPGTFRVVMRREKILKLCANHYIKPYMKLEPNVGSDRSWVWTCMSDLSDQDMKTATEEVFAIRFKKPEEAQQFKTVFEQCQKDTAAAGGGGGDAPAAAADADAKPAAEAEAEADKPAAAAAAAEGDAAAAAAKPAAEEEKKDAAVADLAAKVEEVKVDAPAAAEEPKKE